MNAYYESKIRRERWKRDAEAAIGVLVTSAQNEALLLERCRLPAHAIDLTVIVRDAQRGPLRALAAEAANVARRVGGWDFSSFSEHGSRREDPTDPTALLGIKADRVVAYALMRRGDEKVYRVAWSDWGSGNKVSPEEIGPHCVVGPVWTAECERRRRWATRLANFGIEHFGSVPLAFSAPLSEDGERFARSLTDAEVLISH